MLTFAASTTRSPAAAAASFPSDPISLSLSLSRVHTRSTFLLVSSSTTRSPSARRDTEPRLLLYPLYIRGAAGRRGASLAMKWRWTGPKRREMAGVSVCSARTYVHVQVEGATLVIARSGAMRRGSSTIPRQLSLLSNPPVSVRGGQSMNRT